MARERAETRRAAALTSTEPNVSLSIDTGRHADSQSSTNEALRLRTVGSCFAASEEERLCVCGWGRGGIASFCRVIAYVCSGCRHARTACNEQIVRLQ